MCVGVCVRVQNRCTSGLISCAVETSVMPWSKDSIEIRVKRFSLSLSDKLEHKLICCMTEKRTEILPRCEKAAGERERQRRQDWVSFVWWGPTCSSKATETQLLSLSPSSLTFYPSSFAPALAPFGPSMHSLSLFWISFKTRLLVPFLNLSEIQYSLHLCL